MILDATMKPGQANGNSGLPKRKGSRLVRTITNPGEALSSLMPHPRPHDPNAKRLEDFKLARAFGGIGLDYGLGEPDRPKELPSAASALFPIQIEQSIEDKLPRGYNMRSLQRGDYERGYTKLKAIGPITQNAWDDQCEYMRSRPDVYTILVITDNNDQCVATGTLVLERKFVSSLSMVGRIEDLAVGEGQSGKNLGLRLLDQLDRLAQGFGCVKTVLGTQENNEAFHNQKGYKKSGIEMTHMYSASLRKPETSSGQKDVSGRTTSPDRRDRERAYTAALLDDAVQPLEHV